MNDLARTLKTAFRIEQQHHLEASRSASVRLDAQSAHTHLALADSFGNLASALEAEQNDMTEEELASRWGPDHVNREHGANPHGDHVHEAEPS